MLSFANLIAIVSMTIVLSYSCNKLAGAQARYSNLDELFSAATILESAKIDGTQNDDFGVLRTFARESKSDVGKRYFAGVQDAVDKFNLRAQNYVEQSRKEKRWFTNFIQNIGGPLRELHNAARDYPYLREATKRYEEHIKVKPLTMDDVKCDLAKFQIETTNKLLFVLQTDIKFLATKVPASMNSAIHNQLRSANFEASHDFYNLGEPKPAQRQLLKDFVLHNINTNEVTLGEAVEQFDTTSSLVLGRLMDSCRSHLEYIQTWRKLIIAVEVCSKSDVAKVAKDSEGLLQPIQMGDYEQTAVFCEPFIKQLV